MEKIDKKIAGGKTINLLSSLSKIFFSVVVKSFFGANFSEYEIEGKSFPEFVLDLLNEINSYNRSFERIVFRMNLYELGLTKKARTLKNHIKIARNILEEIIDQQLIKIKNG